MRTTARAMPGIIVLGLLSACRADAPPRPVDERPEDVPVVGGGCTYDRVSLRFVADSVSGGADILATALDSVPPNLGLCLREESGGRWRVPVADVAVVPGDTLVVSGDVIATGTCTPCSLVTRRADGR